MVGQGLFDSFFRGGRVQNKFEQKVGGANRYTFLVHFSTTTLSIVITVKHVKDKM